MYRYAVIRHFYWLFRIIADFYFMLVNNAFWLYNVFRPRKTVEWTDQSAEDLGLLLMPVVKAAKMIREGEVNEGDSIGLNKF
jgi:hypothetical protein